jgi:hypothetical protein
MPCTSNKNSAYYIKRHIKIQRKILVTFNFPKIFLLCHEMCFNFLSLLLVQIFEDLNHMAFSHRSWFCMGLTELEFSICVSFTVYLLLPVLIFIIGWHDTLWSVVCE